MEQKAWEIYVKKHMENEGWTCDRDDEEALIFSLRRDENLLIRDFNKSERRFVQYDGKMKVKKPPEKDARIQS